MRRLLTILCLLPVTAYPQVYALSPSEDLLPDAPSALLVQQQSAQAEANQSVAQRLPLCPPANQPQPAHPAGTPPPCRQRHFYSRFSNYPGTSPMTLPQKGYLAIHDVVDPFNLLTIAGTSAVTIGANSHTAYGPGLHGFGLNFGISLLQDATGEAVGTFAISSIAREDPRYHRMPQARPMRRILHAVSHTIISQHDDGRSMPNYETLLVYPISAEISNLYVPGIADDAKSTTARIFIGLATDPADNLITEFLPDLAAHVHLRVVFVQRILNQVATGQPSP
jgi:hypothetical protein